MLLLVRLISPAEYGAVAFAQATLGIATLIAAGVFIPHALQVRDPATIDWQSHFTAGTIVNTVIGILLIFFSTLVVTPIWGGDVGLALAVLAFTPILGGPAELRNSMLCAHHDWARFRLLSLAGTVLGLGVGIILGYFGAGVVALAIQPVLYALPSAVDLFLSGFKPTWHYDRVYYRDVIRFGTNRFLAGCLSAARSFIEQLSLMKNFSLTANGVYGRSVGLSSLLVGRIGAIVLGALYPILTRAERGSMNFRRNAARVLQGIAWIVIPAATFLAIEAKAIVQFLYGEGWSEVAHLLPASAALSAASALHLTVSRLLLANESRRASLAIDVGSGVWCILLAFLLLPMGLEPYLWALTAVGICGFACGGLFLLQARAADLLGMAVAVAPPLLAAAAAWVFVLAMPPMLQTLWQPARLFVSALLFATVYLGTLRVCFANSLAELLKVFPVGVNIQLRLGKRK